MTTISGEVRINAAKDHVWDVLADLSTVQHYNAGVLKAYYTSQAKEGLDAARICEFPQNLTVEEKVIQWREGESYTLSVDFVQGMKPPIKTLQGTLSVRADGNLDCECTVQLRHQTGAGRRGDEPVHHQTAV